MNNTIGNVPSYGLGGINNLFVVPIAAIFVLGIVAVATYLYRVFVSPPLSSQHFLIAFRQETPSVTVEIGLEETTIQSYPTLLYSKAKLDNKDITSCCSICLSDYSHSDVLRMLPECGHLFHLKCVDPWLRLHPTCPVCRNHPMPTPVCTPLTEVPLPLQHV